MYSLRHDLRGASDLQEGRSVKAHIGVESARSQVIQANIATTVLRRATGNTGVAVEHEDLVVNLRFSQQRVTVKGLLTT